MAFNISGVAGASVVRLLALVLFSGAIAGLSGCSTMAYQPNEGRVKELGADRARSQLKETVMRAKAAGGGVITSVDVTDEALKVKAQQTSMGMFYQIETRQLENEVYFPMVDRVDLYSNNWAFVYSQGGRLSLQVLLSTTEDAKSFADLVMSMRAAKKPGV
jgi:hypothetical protein